MVMFRGGVGLVITVGGCRVRGRNVNWNKHWWRLATDPEHLVAAPKRRMHSFDVNFAANYSKRFRNLLSSPKLNLRLPFDLLHLLPILNHRIQVLLLLLLPLSHSLAVLFFGVEIDERTLGAPRAHEFYEVFLWFLFYDYATPSSILLIRVRGTLN